MWFQTNISIRPDGLKSLSLHTFILDHFWVRQSNFFFITSWYGVDWATSKDSRIEPSIDLGKLFFKFFHSRSVVIIFLKQLGSWISSSSRYVRKIWCFRFEWLVDISIITEYMGIFFNGKLFTFKVVFSYHLRSSCSKREYLCCCYSGKYLLFWSETSGSCNTQDLESWCNWLLIFR